MKRFRKFGVSLYLNNNAMTTQTVKLNPTERLSSVQRKKITIQSL